MNTKRPVSLVPQRPVRVRAFHYVEQKPLNTMGDGRGRETPLKGVFPDPPRPETRNTVNGEVINSTHCVRADAGGAALATSSGDLQGLLNGLDKLTPTERKQLLDHLALQTISTKTDQDRDIAMWSVSVHDGLLATLGGLDMSAYGVIQIRKLLGAAKTWRPVADLATALGMDKLPVTERQYAFHVLAGVLLRFATASAQRTGASLTLPYVVNCCQSIGAAFNAAFPGYIAGGVGPLMFNMMRKSLMAQRQAQQQFGAPHH